MWWYIHIIPPPPLLVSLFVRSFDEESSQGNLFSPVSGEDAHLSSLIFYHVCWVAKSTIAIRRRPSRETVHSARRPPTSCLLLRHSYDYLLPAHLQGGEGGHLTIFRLIAGRRGSNPGLSVHEAHELSLGVANVKRRLFSRRIPMGISPFHVDGTRTWTTTVEYSQQNSPNYSAQLFYAASVHHKYV